ncbi:MAG: protein kinase, partial [Planctomycetota bacterium]
MHDPKRDLPDHQGLLRQAMADSSSQSSGNGAPAEPIGVEQLAARFPGYEIHELIGRGGMGAVYRATQVSLQRPVAIKVLAPELVREPEFGERFLREARALASLTHPSILVVHEFGERDG